jgi:hypothetical protein
LAFLAHDGVKKVFCYANGPMSENNGWYRYCLSRQ